MTGINARLLLAASAVVSLSACSTVGSGSANRLAASAPAFGSVTGTSKASYVNSSGCNPWDVVTLTPATPSVERVILANFGNPDQGAVKYTSDPNMGREADTSPPDSVRTVNCSWQGRFEFKNVPAGEYFVISYLAQEGGGVAETTGKEIVAGFPGGSFRAISMMQRVSVDPGERVVVNLRQSDAIYFSETPVARESGI